MKFRHVKSIYTNGKSIHVIYSMYGGVPFSTISGFGVFEVRCTASDKIVKKLGEAIESQREVYLEKDVEAEKEEG